MYTLIAHTHTHTHTAPTWSSHVHTYCPHTNTHTLHPHGHHMYTPTAHTHTADPFDSNNAQVVGVSLMTLLLCTIMAKLFTL